MCSPKSEKNRSDSGLDWVGFAELRVLCDQKFNIGGNDEDSHACPAPASDPDELRDGLCLVVGSPRPRETGAYLRRDRACCARAVDREFLEARAARPGGLVDESRRQRILQPQEIAATLGCCLICLLTRTFLNLSSRRPSTTSCNQP